MTHISRRLRVDKLWMQPAPARYIRSGFDNILNRISVISLAIDEAWKMGYDTAISEYTDALKNIGKS